MSIAYICNNCACELEEDEVIDGPDGESLCADCEALAQDSGYNGEDDAP